MRRVRQFAVWLVLGVGLSAFVVQARSMANLRAFAPLLTIFGSDESQSLSELRQDLALWEVMLQHTELDANLSRIQEKVLDSLGDFDLEGLHELLPIVYGPFHELHVRAEKKGNHYQVRAPRTGEAFEVCATCKRSKLGDASLIARSRPMPSGDDAHYLLEAEAGVAIGDVDWNNVLNAQHRFWHLLAAVTPEAPAEERPLLAYRVDTRSANPGLDRREVETLAVLWQSFPYTGRLLRTLGRVEDLWVGSAKGGVMHLRASLVFEPGRLKGRYPELASWLSSLDELVKLNVRLTDSQGRSLARMHLDSEHLRLRVEFYVLDGQVLPFDDNQVYRDTPLDLRNPQRFAVNVAGDVNALGVHAQLRHARGTMSYTPTDHGMRMHVGITQVPKIDVDGAALGFVPIEVLDVFVPGDIHGLMMRFMTAACRGNVGKGVTMDVEFARAKTMRTTLEGRLALEALDNFFVRLGVSYWNDHVAPNDDATQDILRVQQDALSALSADVDGYIRARKHQRVN